MIRADSQEKPSILVTHVWQTIRICVWMVVIGVGIAAVMFWRNTPPADSLKPIIRSSGAVVSNHSGAYQSGSGSNSPAKPDPPQSVGASTLAARDVPANGVQDSELMSLNPLEDGWDTEYFNEQAGHQLKTLGNIILKYDSAAQTELETLLSSTTSGGSLVPQSAEIVFQDATLRVERLTENPNLPNQDASEENEGVAVRIADLAKSFANTNNAYAKFKIIRVDIEDDRVTTEQLVELSGRTPNGIVEHHATWQIEWSNRSNDRYPLIRSINLLDFESASSRTGGEPLFSDCTESVFRNETDILDNQLGVGLAGWTRRLESYLNVYKFGHNGIALGDVNGDGLDDVYLCQVGGLPNRLLIHQPDGTVKAALPSAGVDFLDNTRSAILVDFDNDGDQDLALTFPKTILILSNDGSGNFSVAQQIKDAKHVFSLTAADYDQDGDLDLFACVYYATGDEADKLPVPLPFYDARNGGENILLKNEGGMKFSNTTFESGLNNGNYRFSYASVWDDFDNDGDLDLFVANDFGRNNLYQNDDGRFSEITEKAGMADNTFGMSAAAADFNRDGWVDVYKANMFSSAGNRVTTQSQFMPTASSNQKEKFQHLARGNTLFANHEGTFSDVSVESGVTMGRWSWGSLFLDFNNDGWEDIFIANGFVTGQIPDDL